MPCVRAGHSKNVARSKLAKPGNTDDPMETTSQQADVEVRAYFTTPVVLAELEDPEQLNMDLRQTILARRADESGGSHTANACWRSGWDFASWGGEPAKRLLESFAAISHDMTQIRPGENSAPSEEIQWSLSARAVVNPDGEAGLLHTHPNCFWSGVYYADDGGITDNSSVAGELELLDPRGPTPVMYSSTVRMNVPGGENAGGYHRIRPKSGLMVIFPSWLPHAATPYRGAGTRVSIAINLFVGT